MPADAPDDDTRRGFLKRVAALGAAALGAAFTGTGCRPTGEPTRPDGSVQTPTGVDPKPGLSEPVVDCESTETLSPQDLDVRQALDYTPETPRPKERCDNCRFYEKPGEKETCGGCVHFAGPVTDGGWCTVWAAQQQS